MKLAPVKYRRLKLLAAIAVMLLAVIYPAALVTAVFCTALLASARYSFAK